MPLHHATSGDLDRRGTGDIWTLTVQEYLESSRWKRFAYRLARNPVRAVRHRAAVPLPDPAEVPVARGAGKAERRGVHWTNAALLAIVVLMSLTIGIKAYLLIQLPVHDGRRRRASGCSTCSISSRTSTGSGARTGTTPTRPCTAVPSTSCPGSCSGSSGNIGFHHIHHLSPAIPNYNLERCHREDPMFQQRRSR